jgi:hypothetical protein
VGDSYEEVGQSIERGVKGRKRAETVEYERFWVSTSINLLL